MIARPKKMSISSTLRGASVILQLGFQGGGIARLNTGNNQGRDQQQ
jgi:hypothetical protein